MINEQDALLDELFRPQPRPSEVRALAALIAEGFVETFPVNFGMLTPEGLDLLARVVEKVAAGETLEQVLAQEGTIGTTPEVIRRVFDVKDAVKAGTTLPGERKRFEAMSRPTSIAADLVEAIEAFGRRFGINVTIFTTTRKRFIDIDPSLQSQIPLFWNDRLNAIDAESERLEAEVRAERLNRTMATEERLRFILGQLPIVSQHPGRAFITPTFFDLMNSTPATFVEKAKNAAEQAARSAPLPPGGVRLARSAARS